MTDERGRPREQVQVDPGAGGACHPPVDPVHHVLRMAVRANGSRMPCS
jgi:hypothetical protein